MNKIVLPFIAVFMCLAAVTATRSIVQAVDKATRVPSQARTLTVAERVMYQRAIEDVYWRHRIWPKENPDPKPSLDAVMSQAQLESKVTDYLRNSQALQDYGKQPITADQLQAEMDRVAQHTRQPEVLRELFAALGNDPFIIAECLARALLTERLLTHSASEQVKQTSGSYERVAVATGDYSLPSISDDGGCTDDTWTATSTASAPTRRYLHTAVWTGTEMIVWGGLQGPSSLNTGGRYNPSTDSWTATSITNAPSARWFHTAVWTGSEMIVWGGTNPDSTGGRYNPSTDSWTATSLTNAPHARSWHTAVWSGSEMIVWGGASDSGIFNTGGGYNPTTNSWTATQLLNAPSARSHHTAIWTGTEMIVWGGQGQNACDTGGRYNPSTNNWTSTSTTNAPTCRLDHTAVWTGSAMIVWGGTNGPFTWFNTGARYFPSTDTWWATNPTNADGGPYPYTAAWTGSEMIVWAMGFGDRYNPSTNTWSATSTTNAPFPRLDHTAVWTGSEMIVWGGFGNGELNTGGMYCAAATTSTPGSDLGNISTRSFVQTGDNVMIGGFIVQGTELKRTIIRALGPELTQYGVPNVLVNPTLELHDGTGALIASNDNWQHTIIGGIITSDQVRDIRNSGHVPGDGRESAIIAELPTGSYTAIVRGVNNTMGVGLVEVYDLSPETTSTLGNISTRSFVPTGDNVMIGGFIVQGASQKRVIIRAIGPELGRPPYNVPGALADPTLELHDATGALIASNDNWHQTIIGGIITNQQWVDILNSGYVPADAKESAIIADLPAGDYTAIVRGINNMTGIGLVEVYDLD